MKIAKTRAIGLKFVLERRGLSCMVTTVSREAVGRWPTSGYVKMWGKWILSFANLLVVVSHRSPVIGYYMDT